MDKLSYVLGMSLGQSLQASGVDSLEFDDFLSGVKVIFSGDLSKDKCRTGQPDSPGIPKGEGEGGEERETEESCCR